MPVVIHDRNVFMDSLLAIAAITAALILFGLVLRLVDRNGVDPRWLGLAVALVLLEDALLTNLYGFLPDVIGGQWNWQGKCLALAALLAMTAIPAFSRRRVGLTLVQRPGSLRPCLAAGAAYIAFFIAIALALPNEPFGSEDLAFQLTLPGLEEELFYRGLLLLALNEAFRRRFRLLGVDWGWGAALSCLLFGLAHGFSFDDGIPDLDPLILALTAIPSLLGIWLRERSGSLLLPVLVHNAGNSLPMLF